MSLNSFVSLKTLKSSYFSALSAGDLGFFLVPLASFSQSPVKNLGINSDSLLENVKQL